MEEPQKRHTVTNLEKKVLYNTVAKNFLIKSGIVKGDTSKLKVGMICTGGAQAGVFSAGLLCHMIDLGMNDKLDVVVGISASAPNLAHFLTKDGRSAIANYWEENLDGFIKPWRLWKIVDLDKLEHSMHYGRVLDIEAVKDNPTKFYVAVTDMNGNGELIDVKESTDIIDPILATCSLPVFWNKPREVNGKLYVDGSISLPLPVEEIATRFSLTDLLVVTNSTPEVFSEEYSFFQKIFAHFMLRKFSNSLKKTCFNAPSVSSESLENANSGILSNGCRIAIISPSYNIRKDCSDVNVLKKFGEEGKRKAQDFFSI